MAGVSHLVPGGASTIPLPPSLASPASQVVQPPSFAAPAPAQQPAAVPQAVTDILAQQDPAFDAFWQRMVPGESGGKDVPNRRYDARHTASGIPQITDTNWKAYAPKLGIDIQRWPTTMAAPGPYQKAVAKLMYRASGQAPWDVAHGGSLPVGGGMAGLSPESSALYDKASRGMQAAADDLKKRLADISPSSPEFMREVRATTERINAASDAMMRAVAEKPQPPVPDIGKLGSFATIIGIIGGMLTREPAIGALNGAAAAIGAANDADWARYRAGMDTWKTQSDMLLHIADLQQRHLQDIMQDNSREMNDRLAMANAFLRANEMAPQLQMMEAGQIDKAMALGVQVQANIAKMQIENAQLPLVAAKTEQAQTAADLARTNLQMITGSGAVGETAPGSSAAPEGDPAAAPQGVQQGIWDAASTYVQTGKMPPLGMGGQTLRTAILQQVPNVLKARGMSLDDMYRQWAKYGALMSGERALGTRAAGLSVGIGETAAAAPAVVQTSEQVPRSALGPAFNSFLTGTELQSGDPRIVQFTAALNTFLNSYSRAINPTGRMTDQQQRHAYDTLNTAMSKGQIKAGVDQLLKELQYMRSGLGEAVGTVGGLLDTGKSAPAPGGAGERPSWAVESATGPDGEKIYTDGMNWFHADHSPVE